MRVVFPGSPGTGVCCRVETAGPYICEKIMTLVMMMMTAV